MYPASALPNPFAAMLADARRFVLDEHAFLQAIVSPTSAGSLRKSARPDSAHDGGQPCGSAPS